MASKKLILTFVLITSAAMVAMAAPGDLDPTFGTGGKVIFSGTASDSVYRGVREFPNGQLLVFGAGGGYIKARKLFADGSVDTVFGWNGSACQFCFPPYPYIPGNVWDAEILADGDIVVVGDGQNGDSGPFMAAMWKFNADGSIDSAFGTNGRQFLATSEGRAYHVEQWGSTLYVLFDKTGGTYLGRRNLNGGYDPTFNRVGSVNISGYGTTEVTSDLIVSSHSGKSYVINNGSLKRYNADGTLDTTFGISGSAPKPTYNLCPNMTSPDIYIFTSVAFGANGSLMVGGTASDSVNGGFFVYGAGSSRYTGNGLVDTSFNNGAIACGGLQSFPMLNTNATQSDGKILFAAGITKRLNADGSQDSTYATVPETQPVDALISASSGKSLILYQHELHRRLP